MAGEDEHPRWCKGPGVERSMGKKAGRWWLREVEGRAQDLVCIPESDMAQGKKCPNDRQKRPPGNYVFISKVILRQLVIDSPPPPPLQSWALSAMWLQSPMSIWDTGRCMVSGKVCLDFYGLVKRCAGAIKSGNKKCSEIYIYVL